MSIRPLRRRSRFSVAILLGIVVALATSAVKRTRLEVQDWDCPPVGPCSRPVVVSGFPFVFISDYHGISAVGDAHLVSALLGDDHFHVGPFLLNAAVYAIAAAWVLSVPGRRAGGPNQGDTRPGRS
jgi:hypothetical protein